MRLSVLAFLALIALTCFSCMRTRLTRNKAGSFIGTVRDPKNGTCGNLLSPKEYCGTAAATPGCERLYRAVIHAADVQCAYDDELKYTHSAGEYSDTPYLADRLKQIHIRYKEEADKMVDDLENSYTSIASVNEEQELTYRNLRKTLIGFSARMSLSNPGSTRDPASLYSGDKLFGLQSEESVQDHMQRLILFRRGEKEKTK